METATQASEETQARVTQSDDVVVVRSLEKVFRDFGGRPKAKAINDVSFEVRQGEVFGEEELVEYFREKEAAAKRQSVAKRGVVERMVGAAAAAGEAKLDEHKAEHQAKREKVLGEGAAEGEACEKA